MSEKFYIQVIIPLKLSWEPWYSAPEGLYPGKRVNVFFSHRQYTGVVHRISDRPGVPPERISPIIGVAQGLHDITESELKFWEFVSSYYLCSIGEVYKAAYPAGKLSSEQTAPRSMERLEARIARLDEEILSRESKARCSAAVTQRLRAEREDLQRQLEAMENRTAFTETPDIEAAKPGKPLLLCGKDRMERYREAIAGASGDVLVLAPDTIRTANLYAELVKSFPDILRIDSTATAVQRRKASDTVREGGRRHVILSTRIGVFLPLRRLSLVIIDEEQDSSYKQEDPAPRYNGRDCAVQLARLHGAQVILGSSSPSLDTLYNVSIGKYESLDCGAAGAKSGGNVSIIDVGAERAKNGMTGAFSRKMLKEAQAWKGPVVLIRGWEKEEELSLEVARYLPTADVMRLRDAREKDLSDALVVILQADALVRRDDFRSDEKALQLVDTLGARCKRLIVQTAVCARFDGSRNLQDLLLERKEFGFPPYTRLVEVRSRAGEIISRSFLAKDGSLAARKGEIARAAGPDTIIDVDPL